MAKLVQMKLKNCQSWSENSGVIKFSPHMNCIKAPNNVGKSVIMKALSASLGKLNRQELKSLIRHNEEYAEILYLFDDNSVVAVRIYPSQVLYFYTDDIDKNPMQSNGNRIPQLLIDNLSILAGETSNFIINLIDDERPLFLVSSDHKYNYELLTILAEHPILNHIIDVTKDKQSEMFGYLRDVRDKKDNLEYKIEKLEYVDTTELENKIAFGNIALPIFDSFITLMECLDRLDIKKAPPIPLYLIEKLNNFYLEGENINNININYNNSLIRLAEISELYTLMDSLNIIEIPEILININQIFKEFEEMSDLLNDLIVFPEIGIVNILNEILNANDLLNKINTNIHSSLADLIKIETKFETFKSEFIEYYKAIRSYISTKKKLKELENLRLSEGDYDCPIYGRISYKENQCIPIEMGGDIRNG